MTSDRRFAYDVDQNELHLLEYRCKYPSVFYDLPQRHQNPEPSLTISPFAVLRAQQSSALVSLLTGSDPSRALNLLVIRVSSSSMCLLPLAPVPLCLPSSPSVSHCYLFPSLGDGAVHKGRTVSRGFFRIEIQSVENGNAMIDWAQLAQRDEECQQEAQIIHRNDGEILLMKYGHELCYKAKRKTSIS